MDIFENTLLHHACSELQFDAICAILTSPEAKANINSMNLLQETPLTCVINNAYKEPTLATFCVASLLLSGADPNAMGSGCFTPLMLATLHQHGGIVRMLLDSGANPYIRYEPRITTIIPKGCNTLGIAAKYIKDENILLQLLPYAIVSPQIA
jgi:ankyrin repeat protein